VRALAAALLWLLAAGLGTSRAAALPSPETYFGHPMGADGSVLDWNQVVSYFRALEAGSDQIRVAVLGKSTEGRPFIAATIAAPDTLRNLDRYREIQRRLADPRLTPEAEADPHASSHQAARAYLVARPGDPGADALAHQRDAAADSQPAGRGPAQCVGQPVRRAALPGTVVPGERHRQRGDRPAHGDHHAAIRRIFRRLGPP